MCSNVRRTPYTLLASPTPSTLVMTDGSRLAFRLHPQNQRVRGQTCSNPWPADIVFAGGHLQRAPWGCLALVCCSSGREPVRFDVEAVREPLAGLFRKNL